MKKILYLIFSVLCFQGYTANAQTYTMIIKGGHVIDPKNNIDAVMDVAINNNRIALVAKNIDPKQGKKVIDATGLYVTPGLVDLHTHDFPGMRPGDVDPDGFTLRNGVTTAVDAGTSGWKSFPAFKAQTIVRAQTRILAWLNIVGEGMKGGRYESDTTDMNSKAAADFAIENKQYIVGFKVAHYARHDFVPVDRAIAAANMAGGLPIMVDFGDATPVLSIEDLLMKHFRPGDIFTHCFAQLKTREFIVDTATKKVKPFVIAAQKKGVIFDVGYGAISFAYSQAIPALNAGFFPNSISTDLNHGSYNGAMQDILTVMSKFLAMGMSFQDVIRLSTWNPAKEIHREELGSLSVGSDADVAVLNLLPGKYGLYDYTGYKLSADKKIVCELTIRDGKIAYDLNGLEYPVAKK